MADILTVQALSSDAPFKVNLTDDDGHAWVADEPFEAGGANVGPNPKQLLLSSLGACTAMTLRMYAARKQWPLTEVQVALSFNPDGKPASGNDIRRHIVLSGNLSDEQRNRLLEIANACPIHKVLTGEIRIATLLAS